VAVSGATDDARVLVVDDERDVADVYALRLSDQFETMTAYSGEEALAAVHDAVDVVLLDRHMPEVSGDDVLHQIRDHGVDCRVIMLTAVDPDFDIIEMPFDDYLCKPVQKNDLVAAIEQQLTARRYDDRLTDYLKATSKLALLEGEKTAEALESNEKVAALERRAATIRDEMDEALASFDDIDAAFQEITRHPGN
jgi:DNA-binding response OmpR family regulator